MQHHQVPLVDIGGNIEVQALRLVDIGRAIGGEFEQPALVDFEAGLVDAAFSSGAQEVEMLDRAAVFEDRIPDIGGILALRRQQFFQIGIFYAEAARQGLMRIDAWPGSARCRRWCRRR